MCVNKFCSWPCLDKCPKGTHINFVQFQWSSSWLSDSIHHWPKLISGGGQWWRLCFDKVPDLIFQFFKIFFEQYTDVCGDKHKHKHEQVFLKLFRHYSILTFSAHLANVVANWAEMEFAALRLITFITLAGEQKHWERHFLKVLSLNDLRTK